MIKTKGLHKIVKIKQLRKNTLIMYNIFEDIPCLFSCCTAYFPGVGYLLFIAQAVFTSQEVQCRLYGPCAVKAVYLNGHLQSKLTEVRKL